LTGSEAIWRAILPVHQAILRHPFVTGLTDGTLPPEAFARYVVQDAVYLRDYARALALCGARAADVDGLRMFCRHAAEAIDVERELHGRLLGELGIDSAVVATAEASPTCLGYTSFLLQACTVRERHEAVAAILPCYWIYWEVGRELVAAGSPDPRYRTWIETYAGEEFAEAVRGAIAATDAVTAGLTPDGMASAMRHALTAARYEWMFWDSAYRGEVWPV
jgi:thiaminase/transcriptional activator TenA